MLCNISVIYNVSHLLYYMYPVIAVIIIITGMYCYCVLHAVLSTLPGLTPIVSQQHWEGSSFVSMNKTWYMTLKNQFFCKGGGWEEEPTFPEPCDVTGLWQEISSTPSHQTCPFTRAVNWGRGSGKACPGLPVSEPHLPIRLMYLFHFWPHPLSHFYLSSWFWLGTTLPHPPPWGALSFFCVLSLLGMGEREAGWGSSSSFDIFTTPRLRASGTTSPQ